LKMRSSSRGNFCVNILRELIGEVMSRSNMIGFKKDQLDPEKINLVKKWAFKYIPFDKEKEISEKLAWKKCHNAIDEACRRKKEPIK